jgi:FkbM family methyltransferase
LALPLSYAFKRFLRICDCRLTRRQAHLQFRDHDFPFFATRWWDNVSQAIFEEEIAPYFGALQDFQPMTILDVGAATGHFCVVATRLFPNAEVYAFEPALRQRILLSRNGKLNRVERLHIEPLGLWSHRDTLAFRTVGAESSFASVSRFQGILDFPEKVPVVSLDQWVSENQIERIDLIKMDAEGAEVEILQGAETTLQRFHPRLLVQAYHLREGVRTFERCAEMLKHYSYTVDEYAPPSGLLRAF